MLFGMGTVFVFLTILVFATTLMSKLVNRFTTEPEPETEPSPRQNATAPISSQPSPQIMSAIKQAITEHRNR